MTRISICMLAAALLGGCASDASHPETVDPVRLPNQIRWPNLRERDLQAQGRLTLENADSQRVTLDVLLLAKLPDMARVRCWKFDRILIEWGFNHGSAWVWRSDDVSKHHDPGAVFGEYTEILPRITGMIEHPELWRFIERTEAGWWRYQSDGSPDWRLKIDVDGNNHTIVAITMTDLAHHAGCQLCFEDYRERQGALMPWKITASGPRGRMVLRILKLDLDEPPAIGAFDPPKEARAMRVTP